MQKHTALFVSAGWHAQSVDTKAILATIGSGQCTILSYSDIPPAVLYNMARRYVAWAMGIDDIMLQMQKPFIWYGLGFAFTMSLDMNA